MIQYLSFEICKENGQSQYIKLYTEEDDYYLELAAGKNGMYINDSILLYKCRNESLESIEYIAMMIGTLRIYSWPKYIPADYIPRNRIIGCDGNTWSLDFKELEKKTTRHIRGKGEIPEESPYIDLFKYLMQILPDEEFKEWFYEKSGEVR